MDRLLVACAGASALGLAVLGLLAHAVEREAIPLETLPRHEGQRVCVEASLSSLRRTSGGFTSFVLEDAHASVAGFAWFPWSAVPGDEVRACGRLVQDRGHLSLQPEGANDLTVLRPWDASSTPLVDVATEPWRFLDQRVACWGFVVQEGHRRYLSDATGDVRIPLTGGGESASGIFVRADGTARFDRDEGQFRFHADHLEHTRAAAP